MDLFNGLKLEPDNPNNEGVEMQMSICGQKIKLRENPQMAPIQPYEVPNYYEEYISKFGIGDRNSISILKESYENISYQCILTIEDVVREFQKSIEHPGLTGLGHFAERWGPYAKVAKKESCKPGEILIDSKVPSKSISCYPKRFHVMKNHKIVLRTFSSGEKHVSLGCVDFAQLLFGSFQGDLNQEIHFHGIDVSMVSISKCKVLHKMILNQASSRSILQVWFSSGWSNDTLKEFVEACNQLLDNNEVQDKFEKNLIKYWSSNHANLKTATGKWFNSRRSYHGLFQPCANFRHKVDRIDYARYMITGYIFEENEKELLYGNSTMFSIPPNTEHTRETDENFYYTFDFSANFKMEYQDSLKISVDKYMVEKMDMLKKLVNDKSLRMTFQQGFISKKNPTLLMKIRAMDPDSIDWSNIPEYFNKEDFFDIGKSNFW